MLLVHLNRIPTDFTCYTKQSNFSKTVLIEYTLFKIDDFVPNGFVRARVRAQYWDRPSQAHSHFLQWPFLHRRSPQQSVN